MPIIHSLEGALRLMQWIVGKPVWLLLPSTLHRIYTSSWAFQMSFLSLWMCVILDKLMHTNCSNSLDVPFSMIKMCRYPFICISVSQKSLSVSPSTKEQIFTIVSSMTFERETWFSASHNFCHLFAILFLPHCFCSISVAFEQCVILVMWNRAVYSNRSARLDVGNLCFTRQKIE